MAHAWINIVYMKDEDFKARAGQAPRDGDVDDCRRRRSSNRLIVRIGSKGRRHGAPAFLFVRHLRLEDPILVILDRLLRPVRAERGLAANSRNRAPNL